MCEREKVCVRKRSKVCVCVCVTEREYICVRVCVREGECEGERQQGEVAPVPSANPQVPSMRESGRECVCVSVCVRERVCV